MILLVFIFLTTMVNDALADEANNILPMNEFMALAVCGKMNDVREQIEFNNHIELTDFVNLRLEFQENLINVEERIDLALQNNNWNRASILCARADEVTLGFAKSCEPESGRVLFDHQTVDELCAPLRI